MMETSDRYGTQWRCNYGNLVSDEGVATVTWSVLLVCRIIQDMCGIQV